MSQNIEFEKVLIDRVIIKMRRHDTRFHIIGRVLDRCEGIDVFSVRHNDNTTRMLSCAASDARTAVFKAFYLAFTGRTALLVKIASDVAKGRLILDRADRSGFKCLPFAK